MQTYSKAQVCPQLALLSSRGALRQVSHLNSEFLFPHLYKTDLEHLVLPYKIVSFEVNLSSFTQQIFQGLQTKHYMQPWGYGSEWENWVPYLSVYNNCPYKRMVLQASLSISKSHSIEFPISSSLPKLVILISSVYWTPTI